MKNFTLSYKSTINLFLIMMIFPFVSMFSQDKGYVHIATSANTFSHVTYLDNPILNGNPDAHFLFSQQYNVTSNNHVTGIWYNTAQGKWAIFNEDLTNLSLGTKFNIFLPQESEVRVFVANSSNSYGHQLTLDGYSEGDWLFQNNYFNPGGVYNPNKYSNWFNGSNRTLYEESLQPIELGTAFKVMRGTGSTSSTRFSEASNSTNINGPYMRIDHPAINGNPNAVILFNHYWGYPSGENSTYLPGVVELEYNGGNWYLFSYESVFPENVWFDFIIPHEILGVEDLSDKISQISIYPNPAIDTAHFKSNDMIEEIIIYTVSSQEVLTNQPNSKDCSVNVSHLNPGIYLAKIKTSKGWTSQKLIKK